MCEGVRECTRSRASCFARQLYFNESSLRPTLKLSSFQRQYHDHIDSKVIIRIPLDSLLSLNSPFLRVFILNTSIRSFPFACAPMFSYSIWLFQFFVWVSMTNIVWSNARPLLVHNCLHVWQRILFEITENIPFSLIKKSMHFELNRAKPSYWGCANNNFNLLTSLILSRFY